MRKYFIPVYIPVIPTITKLMMITLKADPLLNLPPRNSIPNPAIIPINPNKEKNAMRNSNPSATLDKYVSASIFFHYLEFKN